MVGNGRVDFDRAVSPTMMVNSDLMTLSRQGDGPFGIQREAGLITC